MTERLAIEPLTAEGFAPFGEVLEAAGRSLSVNQNTARRFDDLALVDATREGGRPRLVAVSRRAATVADCDCDDGAASAGQSGVYARRQFSMAGAGRVRRRHSRLRRDAMFYGGRRAGN